MKLYYYLLLINLSECGEMKCYLIKGGEASECTTIPSKAKLLWEIAIGANIQPKKAKIEIYQTNGDQNQFILKLAELNDTVTATFCMFNSSEPHKKSEQQTFECRKTANEVWTISFGESELRKKMQQQLEKINQSMQNEQTNVTPEFTNMDTNLKSMQDSSSQAQTTQDSSSQAQTTQTLHQKLLMVIAELEKIDRSKLNIEDLIKLLKAIEAQSQGPFRMRQGDVNEKLPLKVTINKGLENQRQTQVSEGKELERKQRAQLMRVITAFLTSASYLTNSSVQAAKLRKAVSDIIAKHGNHKRKSIDSGTIRDTFNQSVSTEDNHDSHNNGSSTANGEPQDPSAETPSNHKSTMRTAIKSIMRLQRLSALFGGNKPAGQAVEEGNSSKTEALESTNTGSYGDFIEEELLADFIEEEPLQSTTAEEPLDAIANVLNVLVILDNEFNPPVSDETHSENAPLGDTERRPNFLELKQGHLKTLAKKALNALNVVRAGKQLPKPDLPQTDPDSMQNSFIEAVPEQNKLHYSLRALVDALVGEYAQPVEEELFDAPDKQVLFEKDLPTQEVLLKLDPYLRKPKPPYLLPVLLSFPSQPRFKDRLIEALQNFNKSMKNFNKSMNLPTIKGCKPPQITIDSLDLLYLNLSLIYHLLALLSHRFFKNAFLNLNIFEILNRVKNPLDPILKIKYYKEYNDTIFIANISTYTYPNLIFTHPDTDILYALIMALVLLAILLGGRRQ